MGSGLSLETIPETLSKDEAADLLGDGFDAAAFDLHQNSDGNITRDMFFSFLLAKARGQDVGVDISVEKASGGSAVGGVDPAVIYGLMDEIREKLRSRGGRTFRGLRRQFLIMNGGDECTSMSFQDFQTGLQDYGLDLSDDIWRALFGKFDFDSSESIDMSEFLKAVRGVLNAYRRGLVEEAYKRFDVDNNGTVQIEDIRQAYDASQDPDVIAGTKTSEEVFNEFLTQFGDRDNDGVLSKDEWFDYYSGISSNFDTDAEFELSIRNAWHMAGGEGAAANSSNARVLVTLMDGSQRRKRS